MYDVEQHWKKRIESQQFTAELVLKYGGVEMNIAKLAR